DHDHTRPAGRICQPLVPGTPVSQPIVTVAATLSSQCHVLKLPHIDRLQVSGTTVLIAVSKHVGKRVSWLVQFCAKSMSHQLIEARIDSSIRTFHGKVVLSKADIYFSQQVVCGSFDDPTFFLHRRRKPLGSKFQVLPGKLQNLLSWIPNEIGLRTGIYGIN